MRISSSSQPAQGEPDTAQSTLPKKINAKLLASRENAIAAAEDVCIYLGLPDACDRLVWHRTGSSEIVVTSSALQTYSKAKAAYAASEDEHRCPPLQPEPANLAVIAKISTKGTFLAPDGNFGNSNSPFHKPFDKTQLNFQLEPIEEHSMFARDYKVAVGHLKTLESRTGNPNISTRSSILLPPMPPEVHNKIKLRHNVFRKRNDDDEDSPTDDLPDECRIANWPTSNATARQALAGIMSSHVAQPLPAYDSNNHNKIIIPSQYNTKLRGSLCFVRFTLTHYTFSDDKNSSGSKVTKDVYVADISSITLLDNVEQTTPTKRVAAVDPCSPTPNKRRRAN